MKKFAALVLALICFASCAMAADMSEVRGYDKNEKENYQYLYLGTYPYEESGKERALLWRILGRDGDIITLITEYIIDVQQEMKIDNYIDGVKKHNFPKTTVFEETYLYEWVNTEMAETILKEDDFSAAIVEAEGGLFHIMSYAEMKTAEFGFPNSRYGYTAENPWEKPTKLAKNRQAFGTPYAKTHLLYPDWKNQKNPKYNKLSQYREYGNSSPYWARFAPEAERKELGAIVGANGHLSVHGKADVQVGVRPAMLLDLTKLEITGGKGTSKDPWTMAVTAEAKQAAAAAAVAVEETADGTDESDEETAESGEVADAEDGTAEPAEEIEEDLDLDEVAEEDPDEEEEEEELADDYEEYLAALEEENARYAEE